MPRKPASERSDSSDDERPLPECDFTDENQIRAALAQIGSGSRLEFFLHRLLPRAPYHSNTLWVDIACRQFESEERTRKILSEISAAEEARGEDEVFYHSCKSSVLMVLLHRAVLELLGIVRMGGKLKFIPRIMREPFDVLRSMDAVKAFVERTKSWCPDHKPEVSSTVISVTNTWCTHPNAEGAILRYLDTGYSINGQAVWCVHIPDLLRKCGISDEEVVTKIFQKLFSNFIDSTDASDISVVFQIFIPRKLAKLYTYRSARFGIPLRDGEKQYTERSQLSWEDQSRIYAPLGLFLQCRTETYCLDEEIEARLRNPDGFVEELRAILRAHGFNESVARENIMRADLKDS
jgi:hypothetical protein